MNYNYILSTGGSGINNIAYALENRNNLGSVGQQYFIDFFVITGRNESMISMNSQTLFEDVPVVYSGTNQNVYVADSGDYFLDFDNTQNRGKVFLDSGISVDNDYILLYDKIHKYTGVVSFWTGALATGALGELVDVLEARGELSGGSTISGDLFTGWNVFVNGQKIQDYEAAIGLPASTTGKFFALKKENHSLDINQDDTPDVYGQKFVPYQADFYINGMEQTNSLFLQTYTGVKLIATGIQAANFINQQENNFYSL